MTVSLTEFKLDLNTYMELAKHTDVEIISKYQHTAWLLTARPTVRSQDDSGSPLFGKKEIVFLQP